MAKKNVLKKKSAKKSAVKKVVLKKSAKKIATKSAAKVVAKTTKKAAKKIPQKSAVRVASKTAAKVAKKSIKPATTKKARLVAKASATASMGQTVASQVSKAQVPASQVSVGQPVGDFVLPATGGKEIALASLKGKNVVIYFYPKDLTPGCTLEGQDFTRLYPEFSKANTEVLGVSRDPVGLHEKFKEKEGYCFDLLSDNDGKLTEAFGVWKEKQNYGKTYMGIERSTFFIDANGVLQKEWRGVRAEGHAEAVLSTVKELVTK